MLIHDSTSNDILFPADKGRGLVPRDFTAQPKRALPPNLPLIPKSEWSARIKEKKQLGSRLSDIRRSSGPKGGVIPSLDQHQFGYCFPAGTRIRMADGTQKNIETIRPLEPVLTAEGNIGRVMQLHVREHVGELVTVKAYGHGHLRATPEHPVLTRRGYVPIGEVTAEDWLCVPRYAPKTASVLVTAEHVRAGRVKLVSTLGREYDHPQLKDVPDVLPLTPGFGRILGLWAAEGHIDRSRNKVFWSFNVNETDTLVADLVELIEAEFGETADVGPGPGPNVTQVSITGKLWCQLFASMCGTLAGGKKLHADAAGGPLPFLEAVFWGWMAGDGCRRDTQKRAVFHRGATISHDLALNMFDIANALGLNPIILKEKPQQNRHAKIRQPVWKVTVTPAPKDYRPNYRMEAEETRVWRKVYKTERETFKGNVYNIGVEGDNSYVAEGVSVHNCWAHSTTMGHMLLRALMGQPYKKLSAFMVAAIIKGGRDEGGWGALSLEFIEKNGQCTIDLWPENDASLSHDTAAMRANAAQHRVTADWADLNAAVYDRDLSFEQVASLLLSNVPVVADYNFWGHSVILMDLEEPEPGSFGPRGLNSWGDSFGDVGEFVLQGSKAIPDGAVAPLAAMAI